MSGFRYKQAQNMQDDETPLPVHADENGDIEMATLGEDVNHEEEEVTSSPVRVVYKGSGKERCYLIWAILATFLFLLMVSIAILAHQPRRKVKWCTIGDAELEKCKKMATMFKYIGFRPLYSCISGQSIDDCVNKIDSDVADAVTIDNSNLFKYRDRLLPIMAEDYRNNDFGSYYVAIVQKSDVHANLSHEGLQHKRACVENVELVTGYLYNQSILTEKPCVVPHSLVHLFGSKLCVPYSKKLEGGCSPEKLATMDEHMAECLFGGDEPVVGFVDHISLEDYFTTNSSYDRNNYELLCPGGSRKSLDSYLSCHLFWEPSSSVVVSSKLRSGEDVDIPVDITETLHVAQLYVGFHAEGGDAFNMFKSTGGNDLLFQDATKKLIPLRINCTAQTYLGDDYMRYRSSYDCSSWTDIEKTCLLPQYN